MTDKNNRYDLTILAIRIIAKFAHIILPFDINILIRVINNIGYSYEVQQPPRSMVGIEVVPVGRIAKRGDLEVEFNNDKQILGIIGTSYDKVIDAFAELMTTLERMVHPMELKTSFYETFIQATVKGSKNPLETFASETNEFKKISDFTDIFGEKVSPLGIRLAPSNKPIDHNDWFEYRVEPYVYQPTGVYFISYVFRHNSSERVTKSIQSFQDISTSIIRDLER